MQLLHPLHAEPILRSTGFAAKVSQFLARIIGLKSGNSASRIESPYAGKAWTDVAERELTESIAACRFSQW